MHLSVCYHLISVQYFENMIILIKNICAGLWNYSLTILLVALILSGCTDDPLENTVLPPVPEGCVRVELNLSVDESQKIVTRATDTEEKAYDPAYVWVLVFNTDPDPKLMEPPVKATPGSNEQFYAILRATSGERQLCLLTGLSAPHNSSLASISPTDTEAGNILFSTLNASLKTASVTSQGVLVGDGHYIPMCTGMIALPSGTVSLSQVTAPFRRIASRIDVECIRGSGPSEGPMPTAGFEIKGVTLQNGAKQGYVFPQQILPVNLGGIQTYNEATAVSGNAVSGQIYLYENNSNNGTAGNNPTTLIVRGKYRQGEESYYRLDLLDTKGTKPYPPLSITRNTLYKIKISEVLTPGYRTAAEAIANPPANNIIYDVDINDGTTTDIVSNGEYYIGSDNSEYVLYGEGETNVTVATITHNAPATIQPGSVSITGVTGTGGSPTQVSNPFTGVYNGSTQTAPLTMTLPAGLTSCQVVLRLGTLTKTIAVRRKPVLPPLGETIDEYTSPEYIAGEVQNADWIRLSESQEYDPATATDKLTSPGGNIFIHILPNLNRTNVSVPTPVRTGGTLYLSRSNDQGRLKIELSERGFTHVPIRPYTYTGSFWRHNEKGERLIRIPAEANSGAWKAQVVWTDGNWTPDDILLSTASLPSYPAGNVAAGSDTPPVTQGQSTVTGVADAGNPVYFRIGLKNTYHPTAASPARYAVVAIGYAGGNRTQLLWLRQGEDPDYLMRAGDPGAEGTVIRSQVDKWSVYNLTDASMAASGGRELPRRGGTFTDYPTQAGALFQWGNYNNERYAYNPLNPATAVTGWDATEPLSCWSDKIGDGLMKDRFETCPTGYRRPAHGPTDGNSTGNKDYSAMWQSIWWTPGTEAANSMPGYYADGYFDRGQIRTAPGNGGGSDAMVGEGKNAAFAGRLFYNPYNNASLFLPFAGMRNPGDGTLANAGSQGYYWSASATTGGSGGNTPSQGGAWFSATSGTAGYSIRCVKE